MTVELKLIFLEITKNIKQKFKINEDFEDVSNSDNEETKVIPSTIIYRKLSKEINLQSKNKVIYNLF